MTSSGKALFPRDVFVYGGFSSWHMADPGSCGGTCVLSGQSCPHVEGRHRCRECKRASATRTNMREGTGPTEALSGLSVAGSLMDCDTVDSACDGSLLDDTHALVVVEKVLDSNVVAWVDMLTSAVLAEPETGGVLLICFFF